MRGAPVVVCRARNQLGLLLAGPTRIVAFIGAVGQVGRDSSGAAPGQTGGPNSPCKGTVGATCRPLVSHGGGVVLIAKAGP